MGGFSHGIGHSTDKCNLSSDLNFLNFEPEPGTVKKGIYRVGSQEEA